MEDSSNRLIDVRGIDTYYGAVKILHGVDMYLDPGEIVAIIGPNGAGKSTALKAIFGLVEKKAGSVHFRAEDITSSQPADVVRKGLSFVPQGRAVFPSLTVAENLEMGGFIERDKAKVRAAVARVYDMFPILSDRRDQVASGLSGGEQQVLAMGRAMIVKPHALLLDEPSVGLSPQMVEEVMGKIQTIRAAGTAILMVEQNAAMALAMADRAYVLVMGRNRMTGRGADLLDDPMVQEVYLGRA